MDTFTDWTDGENAHGGAEIARIEREYPEGTVVLLLRGPLDDYSYAWGASAEAILAVRAGVRPGHPRMDVRCDAARGRVQVHVESAAEIERRLAVTGRSLRVRLAPSDPAADSASLFDDPRARIAFSASWADWPVRAAWRVLTAEVPQPECGYRISPDAGEIAAATPVLTGQAARLAASALDGAIDGQSLAFAATALGNLLRTLDGADRQDDLAERIRGAEQRLRRDLGRDPKQTPWTGHESLALHRLRGDLTAHADRRREPPLSAD